MSYTVKQLMSDPELFMDSLADSTEDVLDEEFALRFEEWKARGVGKDHLVRSSSLGTCIRQAYYSYLQDVERTPVTDSLARRRMFMGFVNEQTMGRIIDKMPGKVHGLDSAEQNQFPIHVELDADKPIGFAATTDFVKEFEDKDGKKYLIPMELKSTDIYKWKDFTFWKYHLKQLLLWVYIAKELGYNVPYAVLLYTRRSTMEMKSCIISVDTKYFKMGRVAESWDHWRPYIHNLVDTLRSSSQSKSLPALPNDVPKYICSSCPHKPVCDRDENYAE
jgi:CRISPR/Cas system-associated exonuclease Cas4 (RecB family)|tara:strand:- start:349 stop:1179 length:831 start_codon:yes stop_codon:yes gene_type:complete